MDGLKLFDPCCFRIHRTLLFAKNALNRLGPAGIFVRPGAILQGKGVFSLREVRLPYRLRCTRV